MSLRPAAVVTSGPVPAIPPHLVARLSPAGGAEHRQQLSPGAARRLPSRQLGPTRRSGESPSDGSAAVSAVWSVGGSWARSRLASPGGVSCAAPRSWGAWGGGLKAWGEERFPLHVPLQVSLRETCGGWGASDGDAQHRNVRCADDHPLGASGRTATSVATAIIDYVAGARTGPLVRLAPACRTTARYFPEGSFSIDTGTIGPYVPRAGNGALSKMLSELVGRVGIEPTTQGL